MYAVKIINIYDETDEVVLTPQGVDYNEAIAMENNLEKCLQEPYFVMTIQMDETTTNQKVEENQLCVN